MNNFIFKVKSKILRKLASLLKYRPTSYPYISGDGFRSMSDHIYDEIKKCKAEDIKNGEIVFVKADMVDEWFQNIHPQINVRYKLITHNSDNIIGEKETRYIDEKIIHWYAQNNTYKHDKVTPIPIGIENKRWFMSGWILTKIAPKLNRVERKNRILFGFNINTNTKERVEALNTLQHCPIADEIKERLNPKEYFELLDKYNFVASPEGNGPDCHRTWEALYLGVIPVVKNNTFTEYFGKIGIPLYLIKDWCEIRLIELNTMPKRPEMLYMNYWENIIKKE